ncbi:MAG: hypothetical protein MI743_10920, partial [Sneathiellales bacterium]|nr:hypothetical protein [Sneathiellales bacterium]
MIHELLYLLAIWCGVFFMVSATSMLFRRYFPKQKPVLTTAITVALIVPIMVYGLIPALSPLRINSHPQKESVETLCKRLCFKALE